VIRRLCKANLRINTEKCHFYKKELRYLAHLVSARGIHTDPEKIAAILNIPSPQTTKQVHIFLGVVSLCRRFVPYFTELAEALHNLVKKDTKFKWNEETEEETKKFKKVLKGALFLTCLTLKRPLFFRRTPLTED